MRNRKIIFLFIPILACSIVFPSCVRDIDNSSQTKPEFNRKEYSDRLIHNSWVNQFSDDPNLAGIIVSLEGAGDNPNDHPPGVFYVFWDGKVFQQDYYPDGTLIGSGVWWGIERSSEDWLWVDYSFGSDPEFKFHEDPRKRVKPQETVR